MPYTIVAFSEAQDEGGVFQRMAGAIDEHVRVVGDDIIVPSLSYIIGACAFVGENGNQARLLAPSLRGLGPLYVVPLTLNISPAGTEGEFFKPENPIPLVPTEALNAENNANPTTAELHTVVVALSDGTVTPYTGPYHTVRATVTMALVPGAWAYSELTFEDDLQVGTYDIIGARCECATGIAFRFVPIGIAHRPGGICVPERNSYDVDRIRKGELGVWCSFDTTQPPGLEILGSSTVSSATYPVYIDIVKR